jgi:hypothetical protein
MNLTVKEIVADLRRREKRAEIRARKHPSHMLAALELGDAEIYRMLANCYESGRVTT